MQSKIKIAVFDSAERDIMNVLIIFLTFPMLFCINNNIVASSSLFCIFSHCEKTQLFVND